jgi:hypothetical protein
VTEPGDRGRVKVIDRRRFTSEGEPRGSDVRDEASAPAAAAVQEVQPHEPEAGPPAAEAEPPSRVAEQQAAPAPLDAPGPLPPGPGLADIVDILAQQAMAFLSGQVPGRGRDPATARYFIDLLAVLKEKTSGRLTLEETNFLDDVLYQLRSLYVAATR